MEIGFRTRHFLWPNKSPEPTAVGPFSSFGQSGVNPVNSEENHAGQVGSITVPEPSAIWFKSRTL
jgi:hypothetical protein